jgi:hypothetical protein
MKDRQSKEWIWPRTGDWATNWGLLVIAFVVIASSQVMAFFTRLTGMPWIWCYLVSLGIAALGASLIFYAKLPLYRDRSFFTFGSQALPEERRPFYRWGYRCAILAALLLACLLLSKH